MATQSKILFIGGTRYIGKFIVEASAKAGHQTFALTRESTISSPSKSNIIEDFKNLGVNFVIGDLYNHESLVRAIKQVEVVISTVARTQLAEQLNTIAAIKEAGNVKNLEMMLIVSMLLSQQKQLLPQRLKSTELLRMKEFHTPMYHATILLACTFPISHSLEPQLP
ncbi:Isoflavone reductase-like [Melia azedarach]|uniref:Isoflavone reductase-like n=1 Tax=Melia azedarach TaxID=155640 RepID=A0ACC1Y0R1_MELAZ|nr:Isoflavone reductase-like [Melia azedarach]